MSKRKYLNQETSEVPDEEQGCGNGSFDDDESRDAELTGDDNDEEYAPEDLAADWDCTVEEVYEKSARDLEKAMDRLGFLPD